MIAISSTLGCARFPEFLQNFSERQILWSLYLVVFHALTLKLPIQISLAQASKLPISLRSGEKVKNSWKRAHPWVCPVWSNSSNWMKLCLFWKHSQFVIVNNLFFICADGERLFYSRRYVANYVSLATVVSYLFRCLYFRSCYQCYGWFPNPQHQLHRSE